MERRGNGNNLHWLHWKNSMHSVYFKKTKEGLQCNICPRLCVLKKNEYGFCQSRYSNGDEIVLKTYGHISAASIEPIEKKPIFHFLPGVKTLSLGGKGCTFACDYCQNYKLSQEKTVATEIMSLQDVVDQAKDNQCRVICLTYNEPIPSLEYILDLANLAHKNNLFLTLNTNAFSEKQAWSDICDVVDAMNIDYKGNNQMQYYDTTKIDAFAIVVSRIQEALLRDDVHIEISVPVLSDFNVKDYFLLRNFIKQYKQETPIHLLKIIPFNRRVEAAPTSDKFLFCLYDYFKEKLPFVYLHNIFGNLYSHYRSTFCQHCGHEILKRQALEITWDKDGGCDKCMSNFYIIK